MGVLMRIKIFGRTLREADAGPVGALVTDAGCPAEQIEIITEMGEPDPDCEDEVVLLLGTPETCADPHLEKVLAQAVKGGLRVIWVWPKDAGTAALPAAAAKYSYSVIPWDAEKLRAVIADDDVMCFESPIGESLPKVLTERNLCVDEKVK